MDEKVNWDKVNRGKVRYGFALELYKKGGALVPAELGKVEAFVDYVMEGVEYEQPTEGSGAEPTPTIPKAVPCNKELIAFCLPSMS